MTTISNRGLQKRALEYVKTHPGAFFRQMAADLDVPETSASSSLTQLHDKKLVTRQRRGRYFCYMVAGVAEAPAVDAWRERAVALQDKVDELYAWKLDALAKHPDLVPVDPLLARARKAVADAFRAVNAPEHAADTEQGLHDDYIAVRAALSVLQEVK